MKKIGIITKHSVPNYGAMLQAYGLAASIKQMGFAAELVDYDQPATTRYFRPALSFPPRLNALKRYWRCKRFVKKRQPRSDFHCTSVDTFLPHVDRYDILFTGSDQVWFTGPVQYYDPMYFLDFPSGKTRKASYAPSAGGIDSFSEFAPKVKSALQDFSHLSVRDDNTEALVREMGFNPTRVLDPTFLHDFKDLVDSKKRPIDEPYLLIFGNLSEKAAQHASAKAKEFGITRIASLQYKNGIATDRFATPDPIDWLNLYFHASFVVTTYFHGSIFAAKFNKPFVSIPTTGRIKKVSALLKDIDLESQLIIENKNDSSEQFDRAFASTPDWVAYQKALEPKVQRSISFIRGAVEG